MLARLNRTEKLEEIKNKDWAEICWYACLHELLYEVYMLGLWLAHLSTPRA